MGKDCKKCILHEGAMNVCIGGRGLKTAKFLIVGQNPGAEEDMAGKPFIGRSGKLLVEMLKEAGYSGDEVRFTNAVRCLTPKNRPPEKEEIEACNEYLRAEIQEIRPMAIIAVGDVAVKSLLNMSGIASKRGNSYALPDKYGIPKLEVWPIYHPAFVLRSPNYRSVVVEDLRRIRNSFQTAEKVEWQEMPVITGPIAWDIETDFNYETKEGGNNVVQSAYTFRDGVHTAITRVITGGLFDYPVLHSRNSRRLLVTHNGWAFDLPKCGYEPQGRDTMCLAWLDDETQPKSLDVLASKYCGAVSWKSARTAQPGSEEYKEYNARDAYWTLRVHEELVKRLGDRVRIADIIIQPAVTALYHASKRGIYVSNKKVLELLKKFEKEEKESLSALQEYIGDISLWCRNLKKTGLAYSKPTKFNPGSTNHISEWFCHKGIMTKPTESGINWSTDAASLEEANLPDEFRIPLETYRHAKKMRSTYLEPLTKLEEESRIHPEYYLFPRVFNDGREGGGTYSGRPTATENSLTLPREFKSIGLYSARKGKILAEADYGSIEFRLCAWYAGAKALLRHYGEDPNWDPHTWFARPFYGLDKDAPVSKAQRQVAKSADFSQWFCGYWKTMQNYASKLGIKLSQDTCEKAHAMFHALIPEARPWWDRVLYQVQKQGYIETPTGRRRHFGNWEDIPYKMREGVRREAVNMLAQSLASDLTLLALGNCHAEGLPIVHTWYDAIYFELDAFTSEGQKAYFEETVRRCMIDKPLITLKESFAVDITVPLTVEFSYKSEE